MSDYQPGAAQPSADPLADPGEVERKIRLDAARALIEGLRPATAVNVKAFLEPDAVEAAALLKEHDSSYYWAFEEELRDAAPKGFLPLWKPKMTKAAKALAAEETDEGEADADDAVSKALSLVIGDDAGVTLAHDPIGHAFAIVPVEDGAHATLAIAGSAFRRWLQRAYGAAFPRRVGDQQVPGALRRQTFDDLVGVLSAVAEKGPEVDPRPRVAGTGQRLYIDLGATPEGAAGPYLEVTPSGVRPVAETESHLLRYEGMKALPPPTAFPDAAMVWREFDALMGVALGSDTAKLLRGYQFGLLCPVPPYTGLALVGDSGAGKTIKAEVIKRLIDPAGDASQFCPRVILDLVIAARDNWVSVFDNLSRLPQEVSNVLCKILDGTGLSLRQLYTTADREQISLARPVILTSMDQRLVYSTDLIDRLIVIVLRRLKDAERIDEPEMHARADALAPQMLALLIEAARCSLASWHGVELEYRPRRLTMARWVEAGCEFLGMERHEFSRLYVENQSLALMRAADQNPVMHLLLHWLESHPKGFSGPTAALYGVLSEHPSRHSLTGGRWPASVAAFSAAVNWCSRALLGLGWFASIHHTERGSDITIFKADGEPPEHRADAPTLAEDCANAAAAIDARLDREKKKGRKRASASSGSSAEGGRKRDPDAPDDVLRPKFFSKSNRVANQRGANGPDPAPAAGMPSMITRRMKADLRARGFSDAEIRLMTPGQAHAHLTGAAERQPELCAHCGGEVERGDMLPIGTGGHIHHRCTDDYIRGRDSARPRVDPELQALAKRAVKAKGGPAVAAVYTRLGVHTFDDLKPQQEQQLRAELEELLNSGGAS